MSTFLKLQQWMGSERDLHQEFHFPETINYRSCV